MGCKQTKTTPASVVIATTNAEPIYIKSALKTPRVNKVEKNERSSITNRDMPVYNKSVNFDEKVEVKVRTPTPNHTVYDMPPSTMLPRRQLSNNSIDGDEMNSVVSSVSSEEDLHDESFPPLTEPQFTKLRQKHSNNFWHKSNSISVLPSMNNPDEQYPPPPLAIQQPPVNMAFYPAENSNLSKEKSFTTRRKLPPSSSNSDVLVQSPPMGALRPTTQPVPIPKSVVIAHRSASFNNGPPSQPTYYAFSRRQHVDNTIIAED